MASYFLCLTRRGVIYVTRMKKNLVYETVKDMMYVSPDGLLEYRVQLLKFGKKVKDGEDIVHDARIITYADIKKTRVKLVSLMTNDMNMLKLLKATRPDIVSFRSIQYIHIICHAQPKLLVWIIANAILISSHNLPLLYTIRKISLQHHRTIMSQVSTIRYIVFPTAISTERLGQSKMAVFPLQHNTILHRIVLSSIIGLPA